jgi:hypothetical protein
VVFAELRPGFDGSLVIDGRAIPDDQLNRLSTGNTRLAFTPGTGKEFTQFRPGHVCAVLSYFPTGQSPASAHQYQWCFNLA